MREDYRFTGKEEDVEVGLPYFGKRYLSPFIGRWVSADPLALHGLTKDDPNLYAYVHGQVLKDANRTAAMLFHEFTHLRDDQFGERTTTTGVGRAWGIEWALQRDSNFSEKRMSEIAKYYGRPEGNAESFRVQFSRSAYVVRTLLDVVHGGSLNIRSLDNRAISKKDASSLLLKYMTANKKDIMSDDVLSVLEERGASPERRGTLDAQVTKAALGEGKDEQEQKTK